MKDSVLKKKQEVVQEIEDKIQNSKSIIVMDYRGLTVEEVTNLRAQFREEDVDYKVYKNTLMKIAFKNQGYDEILDYLTGPNGVAFAMSDETASAKVSTKFAKSNKNLEIKAGIIDGKVIDLDEITKLSKVPSKEVLYGKLVGSLNMPISNFVNTVGQLVQSPMRDMVYVFEEVAKRKQAEEA